MIPIMDGTSSLDPNEISDRDADIRASVVAQELESDLRPLDRGDGSDLTRRVKIVPASLRIDHDSTPPRHRHYH